jgi:hypothetical protein
MSSETQFGVIKVSFSSSKKALAASFDGSCWAGARTSSGRVKTWVAYVSKATAFETSEQAADRVKS